MSEKQPSTTRSYFFDEGIRFECTGCGKCCTGESGTIFINARESKAIAARLGVTVSAFLKKYAYPVKGGHSLKEKANGDCVFLFNGKMCGIYEDRPTQCRTFPFWPETLRSEDRWRETCKACEGIGKGKLYSKDEIMTTLQRTLDECRDSEW